MAIYDAALQRNRYRYFGNKSHRQLFNLMCLRVALCNKKRETWVIRQISDELSDKIGINLTWLSSDTRSFYERDSRSHKRAIKIASADNDSRRKQTFIDEESRFVVVPNDEEKNSDITLRFHNDAWVKRWSTRNRIRIESLARSLERFALPFSLSWLNFHSMNFPHMNV